MLKNSKQFIVSNNVHSVGMLCGYMPNSSVVKLRQCTIWILSLDGIGRPINFQAQQCLVYFLIHFLQDVIDDVICSDALKKPLGMIWIEAIAYS